MIALLVAIAVLSSPAESAAAALADLQALPPAVRPQTRYLSLYNLPPQDRGGAATAASYMLNAISRNRLITRPELIQGGTLLRVNLAAYADLKDAKSYPELVKAWDKLAEIDPYYHLRTQIADQHGKIQTVTTDGGWVGLDVSNQLKAMTGSYGPLLRADWFVGQVAKTPAYYEWSGVQAKEADFYKALGVDLDLINKLSADSAANLFHSEVTGKPRRVLYKPGPLGAVWITKDVAKEAADKDPFRTPVDFGTARFKFDASEVFYSKPNQFWGTALFNAAGARQDAVPPNIATDTTAPAGHQELVPLISCIRCHEVNGGKAGLQPFTDDQTTLPLPGSAYPEVTNRIAELYDPARLGREMNRNREDYVAAVLAATAVTPEAATKFVADCFADVTYKALTPAIAAAEVGLQPEAIQQAWATTGDPVLIKLRSGGKVNRAAWESSFQEAALTAESFKNQTR